jgi:pilus assembly protein CpaB
MKQKIVPIVSIVIGLLAFLLTHRYLRAKERGLEELEIALRKGAEEIEVVVAARNVPGGTVIRQADLGKLTVFKRSVGDRSVLPEQAEMLLGRKALLPLTMKMPILWSDIEGGQDTALGLAGAVKPGLRAISLSVSGAAAVSGMVQPNDRVDVVGTFQFPSKTGAEGMEMVTLTVLQDVSVLATGQRMAKQGLSDRRGGSSAAYNTVTIEVTPREAELLVFAQQARGNLTLSLRNPEDVSFERDLPEINFGHIESKLPELNQYRQINIRHKRSLPGAAQP